MAIICPTITSESIQGFNKQLEEVASFAERIHFDLADGVFTPNKLLDLKDISWPAGMTADIHLMYQSIEPYIDQLIELRPNMVIVHAESSGQFNRIANMLKQANIKVGVALLPETPVDKIKPAISLIDHVLIFSGDLGHFGGIAKLDLLGKARQVKQLKPDIEVGWDGGINEQNVAKLVLGGVDVLNVGGGIHNQPNPRAAYDKLKSLAQAN
jgi:ribulose-phosphate 3-epimerase